MKNYIWVAALKIENSSPLPVPPQGERLAARGGGQVEDLAMCETHCAVHGGAVSGTV